MKARLLNWDGTLLTRYHHDSTNNKAHIQYTQDCLPILKANHEARMNPNRGYSETKEMRKIASIPVGRVYEWMQQYGVSYTMASSADFIMQRLKEMENAALKTVDKI